MRRHYKIAIVGTLVLLLLGLAWYSLVRRAPLSTPVRVDFVSFANGLAGERMGLFSITNLANRPIIFIAATVQTPERGAYYRGQVSPGVNLPVRLKAGEATNFSVPLPAAGSIWRVPVLWDVEPSKMDYVKAVLYQNQAALQAGRRPPGLSIGLGSWHTLFASPDVQ
jgi:hypothetical protein